MDRNNSRTENSKPKKWFSLFNFKQVLLHPRGLPRLIRVMKYIILDAKYGSWYLGAKLVHMGNGNSSKGWHGAQSSDYDALSKMFAEISIREDDVIVDVGCGRGRLFNYLLSRGFKNKLIGVDVDQAIAEFTRKRLKKYNQVEILVADVENENSLPSTGTIFYLFNPFTDRIVRKFADHLIDKIQRGCFNKSDRPIIIYYNCNSRLYIFEENSLWKVKKLGAVSHTKLQAAVIEPNLMN